MPENGTSEIRLIAGLGNPGSEYDGSRHNAGFMVVDALVAKLPKGFEKIHACKSYYWRGNYAGKPLILQKPQTYMNLSGEALKLIINAEQIAPEEIMIVYDDMDIPLGKLRLRKGGGSGGHNGVQSVIDCLGTDKFTRLRFGIGKMENGRGSAEFVLSGFFEEERPVLAKVGVAAVDAIILSLRRDIKMAMNVYNAKDYAKEEKAQSDEEKKQNNSNSTKNKTTHQEV